MIYRLARSLVAPGLVAAAFALQSSAGAGMISNITITEGGSALAGASYSTFDEQPLGTTGQTTRSGLVVALAGGAAFVNGYALSQYAAPNFSMDNNKYFYPNATTPTPPANGADMTNYIATGSGTVTFSNSNGGPLGNYFGLLWGSADSFNFLTLNFADGSDSVMLSGSQLGFPFGGPTTYYVNIITSTAISSVMATSTIPSFEIDNVAFGTAAVPEPASLALVALGLTGVGIAARRRRVRARDHR